MLFCGASLGALLVGVAAAHAEHVPAGKLVRNGAAWVVGALLAVGLARSRRNWSPLVYVLPALLGLSGSFVASGLEGVHRWVMVGPLRFNAAELTLPLAIVSLPTLALRWRASFGLAALFSGLLALQPDASQATGFGVAVLLILLALDFSWAQRALAAFLPMAAAVLAIGMPDPLQPVPDVEGIVGLAFNLSPILALAGVGFLAASAAAPLVSTRTPDAAVRAAASGLCGYFAVVTLAPVFGAFPVPLMGMGMSPILGSWLGIGLLAKLHAATARSAN